MKHSALNLLLSLLIPACLLWANLSIPTDALAKPGGEKSSATTVYAKTISPDPAITATIAALRAAKRAGNEELARSLCNDLGWTRAGANGNQAKATGNSPREVVRAELAVRNDTPGSDIMVNMPGWISNNPAMASTADGILYVVVDDVRPSQNYLDIYRSVDDGYTWAYVVSLNSANDLTNPSIAIGEGVVNRLLIAFEDGRETAEAAVFVYWRDLDTGMNDLVAVENYPYWLYNPQICVDSSAYSNWWPYLTYTKGVLEKQDRYDLVYSHSVDYGNTWEIPRVLVSGVAPDCKPDIDYGEPCLYITYTKNDVSFEDNVYLLRSLDLGFNWDPELGLATSPVDEKDPRIVATKGGGAVVVAFTREYLPTDTDIDSMVSQDSGDSWSAGYLPYTDFLETSVDLTVSRELGRIHAAFWSENDIHYTWASWETPNTWSPAVTMTDQASAAVGVRPTVAVNPTKQQEGCVAWTDTRVELQYNVYFDASYPLGNYLILVAHDGLFAAVEPLVLWKQQLGYNVTVVDLATVYAAYPSGDDAESIWFYLHDRHDDLKYVMLVGDIDMLPMRILYPDGNPAYPPLDPNHHNGFGYGTDYYYAEHSSTIWDVDGDNRWGEFTDDLFDYTPELLIGRLPFNEAPPVHAICSNIVTFEQDTGAWKQNALLAHGFLSQTASATLPGTDCASMADYMRTNLTQPNGWTTTTLFEKGGLGPSSFSSTEGLSQASYENNCVFQDFGVINCAAHGNGGSFGGIRWQNDLNGNGYCDLVEEWVYNSFSQRGRIPAHPARSFLYLNGCSSAPIIGNDPNFNSSTLRSVYLIRTPRENLAFKDYLLHGSVGIIGSSAGSEGAAIWNTPADGASASLCYYFYENLINEEMTLGEAFHLAQVQYVQNHGLSRAMRVFNFFGDPSLVLKGIATGKGDAVAATKPIPGHLPPEIALAQAVNWRSSFAATAASESRFVSSDKSVDEAAIWSECAELPDCLTVTSLVPTPDGGVIGTGIATSDTSSSRGVVVRSGNGWDPWTTTEFDGLLSARTIFRTADGTLLVGGLAGSLPMDVFGVIHRSIDDGTTWVECHNFLGGMVTDICQDMAGTLWASSGLNGSIFYSLDDGANWTVKVVFSGGPHLNSIMQASNGRYFVTGDIGFLSIIQSDDGLSWSPVSGLDLVKSAFKIIEVDGRLYAGVSDADGGWVYRCEDLNGESWDRIPEFPTIAGSQAVRSLASDSEGRVFAGVSMGQTTSTTIVYAMDPLDQMWHQYGGFVDLADRVTAILPVSGTVYIGTGSIYGNIYRCEGAITSSTQEGGQTPRYKFKMEQNVPNPFNPSTRITYELPQASGVKLGIYDVSGRRVRLLRNGTFEDAGPHQIIWDGRDNSGRLVPAGVYLYRLEAGMLTETRRMVLVK